MRANNLNAIATATIAFITVLSLMVGLWYHLRTAHIHIIYIVVFELFLIVIVLSFALWVKEVIER